MATSNGRRKKVPTVVRDMVANTLVGNPEATGNDLKRAVEKELKRRGYCYKFTVRTYQNIKSDMRVPSRDELDRDERDEQWSLGTYAKYALPLEIIDCVVRLQQDYFDHGCYLTIRRVQWIPPLHAVLGSLLKDNPRRLGQIAAFYSREQQVSEILKDPFTDTTDLDKTFLIDKDVSFPAIAREWDNTYHGQVESTGDETGLLLDFVTLLLEKSAAEAIAFAEKRPEVQPEAEEWLLFRTRRQEGQK